MRRAVVIRYGDPELASAIEGGMRAAEQMTSTELEQVKAEMQRMRQAEAPLGVRVVRDANYFREQIAEAEANYGWIHPSRNPVTNFLWGVYGLLIEKTCDALDYFMTEMARG